MQLTAKPARPMPAPRRGGTHSCTLGTARDENFNIVPAALLESSDENGAIKDGLPPCCSLSRTCCRRYCFVFLT